MRPGAYFLNMARSEVVDQSALTRALESKGIRAGLDVFDGEPSAAQGEVTDAIVDHPNVYGTHHIGASTDEAEEAVGEEVVRIVQAYAGGAAIPNCVNLATRTPATHLLVVRHADRVGVLANVLGVIREAGINIEDMQNIVFAGGASACARIGLVGALPVDALERLGQDDAIFSISQVVVNA
jgi:D-3-phosphoglycerate dehydrogenase